MAKMWPAITGFESFLQKLGSNSDTIWLVSLTLDHRSL